MALASSNIASLLLMSSIYYGIKLTSGQTDPCQPDAYTVLDDPRRDVTFKATTSQQLCDISLENGWYRLMLNGTNAEMPRSCVQPNYCGTQAPIWLDSELPEVGQEVTSRACSTWAKRGREPNCCFYPYRVTVRNCGDFLVYKLGSSLACNIAFCAVAVSTTTTSTTTTTTTTTSTTTASPTTITTTTTPPPTSTTETTTTTTTPIAVSSTDSETPTVVQEIPECSYYEVLNAQTGMCEEKVPDVPESRNVSRQPVTDNGVSQTEGDLETPDHAPDQQPRPVLRVYRGDEGRVFVQCQWEGDHVVWTWYEYVGIDLELDVLPSQSQTLELGYDIGTGHTVTCSIRERDQDTGILSQERFSDGLFLGISIKEENAVIHENGSSINLAVVSSVPIPCPQADSLHECRLGISLLAFDVDGASLSRLRLSSCYLEISANDMPNECEGHVCMEKTVKAVLFPDPKRHLAEPPLEAMLIGRITYFGQDPWHQKSVDTKFYLEDLPFDRCHVMTDPHIVTADLRAYNLYVKGTFLLFRCSTDNFQVHIRVTDCGSGSGFCLCGLVAQNNGDVISVDNCHGRQARGRVEVTFPLGHLSDDVRIYDGADEQTLTVLFISGYRLRLYVEDFGMSLTLFTPGLDPSSVSGLCGNYNDDPEDDLHRHDSSTRDSPNDFLNAVEFAERLRLAPGQSLFDNPSQGQQSSHNQLYPDIRCDCSPLSSGEICPKPSLFDDVIPSIPTSVDATMTYLVDSVFPRQGLDKESNRLVSEHSERHRRQAEDTNRDPYNHGQLGGRENPKRDTSQNSHNHNSPHRVTPSLPTYFFQPDHLISSQIFIPTWDHTGNYVSEQDASDACAKALFRAPATLTCVEFDYIGPLISVAFDFCKQDIQIKKNVSWSPYSIRIIQSACEFSAIENAANYSLVGAAIPLWPHDLGTALTCPLGCGGGTCMDTGCLCQEGFTGLGCENQLAEQDDTSTTKSSPRSHNTSTTAEPPMTSETQPTTTSSPPLTPAYTILPVVVDIETADDSYPSWLSVPGESNAVATTTTREEEISSTTPTTPTTPSTPTTSTTTTTTSTTTTLPTTREITSSPEPSPTTTTPTTTASSMTPPTALPFIPYTPSTSRHSRQSNSASLTPTWSQWRRNTTSLPTSFAIPPEDTYSGNWGNEASQSSASGEHKDDLEESSSASTGSSASVTETTPKAPSTPATTLPSRSLPVKNLEPVEVHQGVEYEACDVTQDRCTLVAFQNLFKERSLRCRISPVQITPHSYILLSQPIVTSSVRSQLGQFTCVLPYISYLHQIFSKAKKFQSLRLEAVDQLTSSVIGVKFLTIFDSTCQICRRQGRRGCAVRAGTCYIQNKCYKAAAPKPYDPCKQCVPSLNRRDWSVTQDNKAPVISADSSVVVFSGQDARMKIEASDPEGSKVILAVDRKDAFIGQDGNFLWRAIGKDRGRTLREEKFTLTAKDVCNATTALRLVIRSVPCGCQHGGSCLGARFRAVENGHTVDYDCQCRPGYTGSRCELETNECDPSPCQHGTCVDLLNGFRCVCQYGYQGKYCNESRDPCQDDPCFPSVTCFNQGDTFSCGPCPDGFEGDGRVCTASTPCTEKPCFSGVACSMDANSPQGYRCGPCPRYFTGDGKVCRRTVELACEDGVCADVSNCLESNESPGYKCGPCPSGYHGDGLSCTPECNVSCPHRRQTCVRPNICGCIKGYTGIRCNKPVCDPPCQHEGICHKPNECRCYAGYAGSHCQLSRCSTPCKNGGRCIGKNRCLCPYGYSGSQCQILACRHACLNGGHCVGPNICACPSGYTGKHCETPICEPRCLNGGVCVRPGQCQCRSGYQGKQCEKALCYPPCKNSGECRRFNTCKCQTGYSGRRCQYPICRPHCMNGGRCIGPDKCLCSYGWTGHRCDQPLCHLPCQNGGVCINPDMCACPRGFTGANCSRRDTRHTSRYWRPRYYYRRYGS